MTAEDFIAWQQHMRLNDVATARALGLARNTVAKYKQKGAPIHIALACAALAWPLPPWRKA